MSNEYWRNLVLSKSSINEIFEQARRDSYNVQVKQDSWEEVAQQIQDFHDEESQPDSLTDYDYGREIESMVNEYTKKWKGKEKIGEQSDTTFKKRKYKQQIRKKTININGKNWNITQMPNPFCSCTGIPRECLPWNEDGWRSTCCTAKVSMFPLPMLIKGDKYSVRLTGRKTSRGTFTDIITCLMNHGHDFKIPIDLKPFWGRRYKRIQRRDATRR